MSLENVLGGLLHGDESIPKAGLMETKRGVSVNILLGKQLPNLKAKPDNLNKKGKPDDFSPYLKHPLLQFSTSSFLDC